MLPAHALEVPKADELVAALIPQPEGERFEAREESDWFHSLKDRIGTMAALQVVVGNTGAQMMNVVKANVPGKPLENFRKLVE